MPDVSHEQKVRVGGTLDRVGMEEIAVPVRLKVDNQVISVPAVANAFVSLDKAEAKGIHMSRVYLRLKESLEQKELTFGVLADILRDFVERQEGLSQSSSVQLNMDIPLKRKALLSQQSGWRYYPLTLLAVNKSGQLRFFIKTKITYSSTCPCSAALARQLVKENFLSHDWGAEMVSLEKVAAWLDKDSSINATPHAQRSFATVKMELKQSSAVGDFVQVIDDVEEVLGTPVQTAVKREDEQAFAKLNGTNLMFCEDAARKIKNLFENDSSVLDYFIHVDHQESLHAHNAVAMAVKGIEGGFTVEGSF